MGCHDRTPGITHSGAHAAKELRRDGNRNRNVFGAWAVMDFRQLEYFLRVAQRKNISLAAVDLNIAQPTLTKSIRLLEEKPGCKWFERLPRGVALTTFGTTLLRHAEAVHVQMKDAGHEIAAQRSGAVGTVLIGAGPTWLRRYLPAALARTISAHPL